MTVNTTAKNVAAVIAQINSVRIISIANPVGWESSNGLWLNHSPCLGRGTENLGERSLCVNCKLDDIPMSTESSPHIASLSFHPANWTCNAQTGRRRSGSCRQLDSHHLSQNVTIPGLVVTRAFPNTYPDRNVPACLPKVISAWRTTRPGYAARAAGPGLSIFFQALNVPSVDPKCREVIALPP